MVEHKTFDIGTYMQGRVIDVKPKTVVVQITNKRHGDVLGYGEWFGPWRQYCLERDGVYFSPKCLRELADYLERTTRLHRELKKSVPAKERGKQK